MMNSRLFRIILAGAFVLANSNTVHADDIQDANALLNKGQRTEALDTINHYLKSKPKDARARFLQGLILYKQGQTEEAIKVYSTLIEDYPEMPEPYNNLAVLYSEQGEFIKARQTLEMAIRDHPNYAIAHGNLADIYIKLAAVAYDRSLQLDRNNTLTQKKLALAEELLVLNKNTHSAKK
ncbi:MAG: tetratricopeptide repeat protein [Pseudomonadota bacterium]